MTFKKQFLLSKEFDDWHRNIKTFQCPHCNQVGFLILHGYLLGYGVSEIVKRGHRIYCSNRCNSRGCGRTFSILKPWYIRNYMICAHSLSRLLEKLASGICLAQIHNAMASKISKTTVYRLYHKFRHHQSRIRTLLTRIKAPPDSRNPDPVIQTITHLCIIFSAHIVARFQYVFQVSFF